MIFVRESQNLEVAKYVPLNFYPSTSEIPFSGV